MTAGDPGRKAEGYVGGVGAGAEQHPHVLYPVEGGGLGKREVQVGGLADRDIDFGARRAELLAEPGTGDRLAVGKHVQQGVGLPPQTARGRGTAGTTWSFPSRTMMLQ